MPLKLVLSTNALPFHRTQTKDSIFSSLASFIFIDNLPYFYENSTVLKRNSAVPKQKCAEPRRNNYRTYAEISRTQAKILPNLNGSDKSLKTSLYLNFIQFLKTYVSKYKNFNYYYYKEKTPPYSNETPIIKGTLCKKS